VILKKIITIHLSIVLLFTQIISAAAIKSFSGAIAGTSQSTSVVSGGKVGLVKNTSQALIGDNPLSTQNYNDTNISTNFNDYKKITLKRVILETLASSNKVHSAKEKYLVQAKINYEEIKNDYLPTINFEFSAKKEKKYTINNTASGIRDYITYNEDKYKVTIDQPLYSGGSTAINIQIKNFAYQKAKNQYEIVVNQVIQDAIKAYFQLLFNIEKVELANKNMKKLNEILQISQIKYDSGAISVGDLAAIKAGVASAQTDMNNIKSKLTDSIDFYLYLLSDKFKKTKPFEKNFDLELSSYEGLKNNILTQNLALKNYEIDIASEKYKIKNFNASFKPKVDLQMKVNHILDQEGYIDDEETYSAKVIVSYNIFNRGKDVNKVSKSYSSIQQKQFDYKEEIKKISWDTSKLYNSIKSLGKSLKSNKDEILSSNEMVDVYWEGFQLGEQDLQVLLQGQRQLNSAELSLLKFKQDYLTNIFKVLNQTNKLASFFNIDPYSSSFIDYSSVEQMDTSVKLTALKKEDTKDLNTTMNSYLDVINEYSFEDIVNFKDKFLQEDDTKYTILVSEFDNNYKAYEYIRNNRLFTKAFVFDYIKNNGTNKVNSINKEVQIKTNLVHGVYNNKDDAKRDISNMFETKNKTFTIKKVSEIKDQYAQYINGLNTTIQAYIIQPKPKKIFSTNEAFKDTFMNSNKDKFTINVVSLSTLKQAEQLLNKYKIYDNSFVFRYAKKGEWVKVMHGIFNSYEEAFNALNKKKQLKDTYHPIIEKIGQKQELYKKYIQYNRIIKVKTRKVVATPAEIQDENTRLLKEEINTLKSTITDLESQSLESDIVIENMIEPVLNLNEEIIPKVEVKKVIAEVKKPLAKKEEIKFDPKPKKEILPVKEKAKKVEVKKVIAEVKKPLAKKEEIKFDPKPKKEILSVKEKAKKVEVKKGKNFS
jgi:adhesin transport system outer membrane protein